jgi:hypothetical protein
VPAHSGGRASLWLHARGAFPARTRSKLPNYTPFESIDEAGVRANRSREFLAYGRMSQSISIEKLEVLKTSTVLKGASICAG